MQKLKRFVKNKKGLEFKSSFFALAAFSLIIIAVGAIVGEWNNDYNSGIAYDLGGYNKLDSLSTQAEAQQGEISVKSSSAGESGDFEGTSLRGVFGVLNNIYSPFRLVFGNNGMLDDVTERFAIPDYLRRFFVTAMVMAITFTLIAIFFKLPRSSV